MQQNNKPDPRLDIPAEANLEKHINFMEVEEESAQRNAKDNEDKIAEERRKQWQEGLREGEELKNTES